MDNRVRGAAWRDPWPEEDTGSGTSASIAVLSGCEVTLWSSVHVVPGHRAEYRLQLDPGRPVVVGRYEGRAPDYLDPDYLPTTRVPGTDQSVLDSGGRGGDLYVSRGHFMLRAIAGGVVFINAVPRRGGGLRPPKNGTWLVAPMARALDPSEEYLIESGMKIVVRLPNGSDVRIGAD